ncbi:hypothetical protein JB92DRAFT_227836 [Gautieria morchelliformis]|nr:hypothetical protein JB92DRAFT_227836 [Gautieria morchelliformis]
MCHSWTLRWVACLSCTCIPWFIGTQGIPIHYFQVTQPLALHAHKTDRRWSSSVASHVLLPFTGASLAPYASLSAATISSSWANN